MAELEDLDSSLVTVGQPVEGGCCYVCFDDEPEFPTDATTALGEGWESVGELTSDGYTESSSISSTDHKGWHGSVLLTTVDDETNTFQCAFVEVNRPTAAKLRYGADCVEVDEESGTVSHIEGKAGQHKAVALVFEELESNGWKRRTLVRKAVVNSFDDIAHQRGSLMSYGMTFTANESDGMTLEIFRAQPSTQAGMSYSYSATE